MNKTLIVIDAQEDFTRGALRNEDAIKALPVIQSIVKYSESNFDHAIYYTKDTHYIETYRKSQEGKNLPIAHCIKSTKGWQICPEVWSDDAGCAIEKNTFGCVSWKSIGIDGIKPEEIWICGFCTDICVISNVLILKALFPEIPIVVFENACAGVTPEKHNAAIEVMKSCQIKIERWEM